MLTGSSVGTIAYMPGLRLWKDPLVGNEAIAYARRYIMPFRKGYNYPMRELNCHYPNKY